MTVLGIETATVVCAAAVAADGNIVAEQALEQHAVHAEKLLTLVDRVLRTSRVTAAQLDAVAVSIGPGSFTGLRIGLSVAKGLVYATGRPLVAVPTLEALACRIGGWPGYPRGVPLLAVLDARRNEVYCQLFRTGGDRPFPVWEAKDCTFQELDGMLPAGRLLLTGDARRKVAEFLRTVPGRADDIAMLPDASARCAAGPVALLGEGLLRSGVVEDPAVLEPRYIKEFFLQSR